MQNQQPRAWVATAQGFGVVEEGSDNRDDGDDNREEQHEELDIWFEDACIRTRDALYTNMHVGLRWYRNKRELTDIDCSHHRAREAHKGLGDANSRATILWEHLGRRRHRGKVRDSLGVALDPAQQNQGPVWKFHSWVSEGRPHANPSDNAQSSTREHCGAGSENI